MPISKFGLWDLKGPDKLWQLIVLGSAEALGTATLLFLGCSAALPFEGSEPSLLYVAFAFGFAISIAVMGIGHISGAHINPAVSLTALVLGKLSPITFLIYVGSQCFGAVIGMQTVLVAASGNYSAEYCLNRLNPNISPFKGVFIESILTAILVLLVLSVWDSRNSTKHDSAPIRFGVGVIALVIAGAKFTGCSMNPARSFAPTILSGNWENHWVYWVGPSIGAVVMGIYYKYLYLNNASNETMNSIKEDGVENEPLTKRDNIILKPVSKDGFVKTSS